MKIYKLTAPNRAKKAQRMKSRDGLFPYYAVIERVPEEGKRVYTKLVTISKAIVLLRGRLQIGFDGRPTYEKLSREFRIA